MLENKLKYNFIRETVKKIVELLIARDFQLLWLNDLDQRITVEEMADALEGYGKMTMPPSSAFEQIDVYPTDIPGEFRIDFDLWFDGVKSDLTLQCTVNEFKQRAYSIDDIRML